MSAPLDLQKDIAAFLNAHAEFQYVPIIREYADVLPGNALLGDYVEKTIKGDFPKAGKFGLCCVISSPVCRITDENSPGPVQDLDVIISCCENIATNKNATYGTGIRADALAETVKRLLHLWCHDGTHELKITSCEEDRELPGHLRGWLVGIRSMAHALQPYPFVSTPRAVVEDFFLTITCPTSGASIYFTTNGSYPAADNDEATLYTAPVDVSVLVDGTQIRSAAFKANMRGSDCFSYILNPI
jgi:hypothetical protein